MIVDDVTAWLQIIISFERMIRSLCGLDIRDQQAAARLGYQLRCSGKHISDWGGVGSIASESLWKSIKFKCEWTRIADPESVHVFGHDSRCCHVIRHMR